MFLSTSFSSSTHLTPLLYFYHPCLSPARFSMDSAMKELQATFQKHDNAAGNSVKKVIGIISLIFLSVLLVMGVYVSYKRYMLQPASIFTMHFSNPHAPHAPHAPANVEMQKVNEIQIKRQGNITELVILFPLHSINFTYSRILNVIFSFFRIIFGNRIR